jgi:hypothetical protein
MTDHDPINRPSHYTQHPSGIECITITEHFGFNVGCAIKYLWRAGLKGDAVEDLRKARWYVEREIARRAAAEWRFDSNEPPPVELPDEMRWVRNPVDGDWEVHHGTRRVGYARPGFWVVGTPHESPRTFGCDETGEAACRALAEALR